MNEDSMKELERLRKQISQQEKMASLGLLSAGIAHEIQNPLNFVINFSKLSCKLLQDMEDVLDELESKLSAEVDEEIREIMDDLKSNMCKIEENGNRASSIVRGIPASATTASASRTTSKPRYSNRSSPRSPLPRLRVSVCTSVVKSS